MPAKDSSEIKNKILFLLQNKGPSLPVHIAREIGFSILFTSAFLSELLSEKKIKISNMRVGSSPLYFISGQESKLENFAQYLKSKEREAFEILKGKKFLADKTQVPAIRVALREIRDFAVPFRSNTGEIFWRYFLVPEKEFKEKKRKAKAIIEKKPKPIPKISEEKITKPLQKKTRKKEKSDFVKEVLKFLENNTMELLEEIDFKKREFLGTIKIRTGLGEIELLVIAKDKKKITENDFAIATQKSHSYKRMILFISKGEANKKAKEYIEKYKNIIKFLKM